MWMPWVEIRVAPPGEVTGASRWRRAAWPPSWSAAGRAVGTDAGVGPAPGPDIPGVGPAVAAPGLPAPGPICARRIRWGAIPVGSAGLGLSVGPGRGEAVGESVETGEPAQGGGSGEVRESSGPGEPAGGGPRGVGTTERWREAVEAAKAFIEEHLGEPLDVVRISREVNLSRPHFTRVFRAIEGVPPWSYVTERRVRRAVELLESDRPLSEVALDAGFADQSHLTRVFKRVIGRTPGEVRRNDSIVQDGEVEGG